MSKRSKTSDTAVDRPFASDVLRRERAIPDKYQVVLQHEDGEVPTPPATAGKRTEKVKVRLSVEEKLVLEASARRRGYAGLADYIRAVAIAGEK